MSSNKPKKTLSEDQLEKMREGRKKAMEKRKKEREEAKEKAKELESAKKSKDKQKLLELEMQALQQQQDRIDNLKMQVERKKEVKSKLKNLKDTQEKPDDQKFDELPAQEAVLEEMEEVLEEVQEAVEEEVELDIPKPSQEKYVPSDEEYSETFKREANKMRNKIPQDVRHIYDDSIKKFDFSLSLDDNIKYMIEHVKTVVNSNTDLAKSIRNKQIERENKKEVVQKSMNEKVCEQAIDSKLSKLMKMKY